jgi:hypothetical protein
MKIQFSGLVSKDEYTNVVKYNFQKRIRSTSILFGIILFFFLAGILVMAFSTPDFFSRKILQFLPAMLGLLAFLSYPFWVPLFFAKGYYQPTNFYQYPISGEISEEMITLVTHSVSSSFQWNFFTKYDRCQDIVLLYNGKTSLSIFSRSLFASDEDWNNFIELVKTNLKKK